MVTENTSHEKLVKEAISEAANGNGRPDLIEVALEIYRGSQALIESGQRDENKKFSKEIEKAIEGME